MGRKSRQKRERLAPLPASPPGMPYQADVVDADFLKAPNGEVALMWLLRMVEPPEWAGRELAHASKTNIGNPGEFLRTAEELGRAGLTTQEAYDGDVPALLKGRRVLFNYTPPTAKGKHDERIEIVAALGDGGAAPTPDKGR